MRRTTTIVLVCSVLSILGAWALPEEEAKDLDRLRGAELPVTLRFEQVALSRVVGALAEVGDFEVEFADEVGAELANVALDKQSLKQVLIVLADDHDLELRIERDDYLVIRRRPGTSVGP